MIGHAIKELRKERLPKERAKQFRFAAEIGISQTSLSQIETNAKNPHTSTLRAIATHLRVHICYIYFRAEKQDSALYRIADLAMRELFVY